MAAYPNQSYYSVYPQPQSYYSVYPPTATKQQPLFAPGTDPEIIRAFRAYDEDGNGFIDDEELQKALSTADLSYSIRTVHLLMFKYNNRNCTTIVNV
ncbi:hypothetical protein SUGI_1005310 [Cryptomeria japonica]|nr:hypothetical protein SUGI_1005310 [Cryptomeria japonica]